MKTTIPHIVAVLAVSSCMILVASTFAYTQRDTVEFKLIPKYYPQDNPEFIPLPPPEIAYSPRILYPSDPKLQGREADVWVRVLVNRKGTVNRAEAFKSTDKAFNKYALKYAKQYKFKWSQEWPEALKNRKNVWISIPIHFRQ